MVRGPRQVGETTGLYQIIEDQLRADVAATDILFVRFDLEVLREEPAALRNILRWYVDNVRKRPLDQGPSSCILLDEIHKLRRWHEEIKQNQLADMAIRSGLSANQPTVGQYLHYLADALLIHEFRRYPLGKKSSARVPAKITVSDLGVRNAVFRSSPSLWESDPTDLGPLVETLVQSVVRDYNLQVHFFRDYEDPKNRRSPVREVDFVAERADGTVVPIEVKFRKRIDEEDLVGIRLFMERFHDRCPLGIVVTRELSQWDPEKHILFIPLQFFLLAF